MTLEGRKKALLAPSNHRDVESRILREHQPKRVSESRDVLIPGSVRQGVQGDVLPVTGREESAVRPAVQLTL
jgi:hypothetical protein